MCEKKRKRRAQEEIEKEGHKKTEKEGKATEMEKVRQGRGLDYCTASLQCLSRYNHDIELETK